MSTKRAVFVKCTLSRGVFPTECVFSLKSPKGNFCGTAPIHYCYGTDGKRFERELPVGEEIQGFVVGLVVEEPGDGYVRVYLPDGAVYSVTTDSLTTPAEASGGVPVQS